MLAHQDLRSRLEMVLAAVDAQRASAMEDAHAPHPFMTLWDLCSMIGQACEALGLEVGAVNEIEVEYEVLPWCKENSYTVIVGGSERYAIFDYKFECFSVMSFQITNKFTTNIEENTTHE